ncbi:MAG: DNA translocase FtsK 4TM domain-containing protein [Candidatus Binatia bacterium]|nr:DNA translocase FtsK 4TM domain-containing protein [Candidatus Binatia bacterium]
MATRGQAARKRAQVEPVELEDEVPSFGREAICLFLCLAGLLIGVAIATYAPATGENAFGPLGAVLADLLVQSLGLASLLVPTAFFAVAAAVFNGARPRIDAARVGAGAGALVSFAILANLAVGKISRWEDGDAGGMIGGLSAAILEQYTGPTGAWVTALASFLLFGAFASGQSLFGLAQASGRGTAGALKLGQERLRDWASRDEVDPTIEPIVLGHQEVVPGRTGAVRPSVRERRAPVISTPKAPGPPASAKRRQAEMPFSDGTSYCLPDLAQLDPPVEGEVEIDHDALIASSRVLEAKLHTFNVQGTVQGIHPGPVITTYEFEPAAGIKVNRITALADDLAMAMQAMSVRILAPIPGKSVVGIEVANPRRETVSLREVCASDAFQQSKSTLALALGKDTTGNPAAGDLARMPHLLVAGATGAGKSVFLNTLLMSILMRASPRDVQMVLVDPKMLELATYEEIPHLLVPVITEAKLAVAVLINLVTVMNERYKLMKEKGVRNLDSYNKAVAEGEKNGKVIELDEGEDADGDGEPAVVHQHMPRIVVIIDELADLMMTRRDCEEPITRLAQKARAAGIHMVIATQRPSVDVITGLIKANFPARISFQVAGKVDSRTILDTMGAERLLGMGDMLFLPPGTSRLQRLHGAFVSDEEIQKVTDFVRDQQQPHYRMELFEEEGAEDEGSAAERGEEQYDAMYDEAVAIVTDTGKASISYVQRRLQVGYNRAARMIECMEREGVVSSPDHRGTREVVARAAAGYDE